MSITAILHFLDLSGNKSTFSHSHFHLCTNPSFPIFQKEDLNSHPLCNFLYVSDTCRPGTYYRSVEGGFTWTNTLAEATLRSDRDGCAVGQLLVADANFVFRAHTGVRKTSINKRLFKHGEAHRSLPLPPCFPISPVLPAVFSKHIPVGKQPPGGLGLSGGAYICLASICLWIRNLLMHITPDKQVGMESGSSVWHQHFFCPTASFSRDTSWITLCQWLCRCVTQSTDAANIIGLKRVELRELRVQHFKKPIALEHECPHLWFMNATSLPPRGRGFGFCPGGGWDHQLLQRI